MQSLQLVLIQNIPNLTLINWCGIPSLTLQSIPYPSPAVPPKHIYLLPDYNFRNK